MASFRSRKRSRRLLGVGIFALYLEKMASQAFLSSSVGKRRREDTVPIRYRYTPVSLNSAEPSVKIEDKLESMTVKELRQLLKDSDLNERGIITKLKLKQDLINYLKGNLGPSILNGEKDLSHPAKNGKHHGLGKFPISMPASTQNSPRDVSFEKVYAQYPPMRNGNCTGIGIDDVRQKYHPMFEKSPDACSDLDIVFVGTASCTPSITRGVSCTALRLNFNRQRSFHGIPGAPVATDLDAFKGGTWLFDCGECTQLQVQKTGTVRPGKINKIFLTHAHGDHSFGLPGLLCLMGQDRDRQNAPPVDIYGPEGLRMWLRVAIRYSVSRIVPNYRVHELKDIPMAPEWELNRRSGRYFNRGVNNKPGQWGSQGLAGEDPISWISRANLINLEPSPMYGEIDGGRDIFPDYNHPSSTDGAPVWEVEDEGDVKVCAAPMSHGIPCVGYVVVEQDRPGRLRDEYVRPIVERNIDALRDAGFKIPMKALAVIKNLPTGSAFTFPDGTVVSQQDAVEPPRTGRKIVICGDTASSRAMECLATNADVVIHEATNSYLAGIDKGTSLGEVTKEAVIHGHSTPNIAGEFAKRVRAKRLILNHFSARYKGDQAVDSISIMSRIERLASKASGLDSSNVAAAWDFMILPVKSSDGESSDSDS